MKKLQLILLFAFALAVGCASILVSCKKDTPQNTLLPMEQNFSSKAVKEVWQTINNFFETRQHYKAGLKTDNGTVTTDRAREILDMTINYQYGNPNQNATDKTLDTIRIAALVPDSDGNVNLNEVIEAFDVFGATIEQRENLNSEVILNYFAIQFPEPTRIGDSDSITIVYSRGLPPENPGIVPAGPFGSGDNWVWGLDFGNCANPHITNSDAGKELSKKFMYEPSKNDDESLEISINFVWDVEYKNYHPKRIELTNGGIPENNYWLFYLEGKEVNLEYCIDSAMMNYYWRNIKNNVVSTSGIFHYSPILSSPYRECEILSQQKDKDSIIHEVRAKYCKTGYIY